MVDGTNREIHFLNLDNINLFSLFFSSIVLSFYSPGQVDELVKVLSWNTKAVGLIPGQDTYKNQPMNA